MQPAARGARNGTIRDAALVAGVSVSIELLRRAQTLGRMRRAPVVALGLLTAGSVAALVQLMGGDVRSALAAGQPGLMAGFLETLSAEDPEPHASTPPAV